MKVWNKRIRAETIVLSMLALVLAVGIVVGIIRHTKSAGIVLEGLPPEPLIVNINTASEDELTRLPGIGPSIAARIVAYRREAGPFKRAEGLMDVSGIGPSKLAEIKPFLEVR